MLFIICDSGVGRYVLLFENYFVTMYYERDCWVNCYVSSGLIMYL